MIHKDSVIRKQYNNFKNISLWSMLSDVVANKNKEIVQVNKEQMLAGETGSGLLRLPHTDLFDRGTFQSSMFLQITGNSWYISSRDEKTIFLTDYQGQTIFDFNPQHLKVVWNVVEPEYFRTLHKALNK